MNRATTLPLTIGRPPEEWHDKVAETTRVMVGMLRESGTVPRAEAREVIIRAARVALGEEPSAGLVVPMLEAARAVVADEGHTGGPEVLAGMFRFIVDEHRPDWRGPLATESVMAEVQKALDEQLGSRHVSPEWQAKIGKAGRLVAALLWARADEARRADRAGLLAEVLDHAHEALSDAPNGSMFSTTTLAQPDGSTIVEDVANSAGVFRLVIAGFDPSDPDVRSTVLTIIEREARAELAQPIPGQ